jgi:LmbE family N-acetylglucosaminyl deacetylase
VPRTAVHVSPHPDDEVLGCGATLVGLAAAGWRVVNLACSLGRAPDRARRAAELDAALSVLGIEGRRVEPPLAISRGDDLAAAEERLVTLISEAVQETGARLVISPHPEDAHHGHAVVGRAAARVAAARVGPGTVAPPPVALRWWAWGLWRDLPRPNRYIPYGEEVMARLGEALACHRGEIERNGYADLLVARGRVNAVLGAERVGGFGSGPLAAEPYADLLEERVDRGSGLELAPGHVVGLVELADPDPDRLERGADAVLHGGGDGPE